MWTIHCFEYGDIFIEPNRGVSRLQVVSFVYIMLCVSQASLERVSVLASSRNKCYYEIAQSCSIGDIAGFGRK